MMLNAPVPRHCDIMSGIDKSPAEAALIRSYRTKTPTADIVAAEHLLAAHLDTRVWYFHVAFPTYPTDSVRMAFPMHGRNVWPPCTWSLSSVPLPDFFMELAALPLRLIIQKLFLDSNTGPFQSTRLG